ncbi:hypothetical protein Hanom_Chr02g00164961 [Helianthus anomalus]
MNAQMKESPKLLHKSAGKNSCCIFRVPPSLVEINKEAYQPRIVSIGPYHYGNKHLEMIQEHKWRYLDDMITRTGKSLGVFMNIIVSMENKIRESYSESTDCFGTNDLAKMMVLDGVFLIQLFLKVGQLVPSHQDDPIFRMAWIRPLLTGDLLRLENQIPFFVLQELFKEFEHGTRTLQSLILEFFNYMVDRRPTTLRNCENLDGKHLLDFIRMSYINTIDSRISVVPNEPSPYTGLIKPATKLEVLGVKFKVNHQADSFLDIKLQNGLLSIPQITVDDLFTSFLMNCMAFEQCYNCHCLKEITAYIVFMGCLLDSSRDLSLLLQKNIIKNYFGTNKEILKLFNQVGKSMAFDVKTN